MCRSIKKLRGAEMASEEEIVAAARQFIRKVSGYTKPSKANEAAFNQAVIEVTGITKTLLESLPVSREVKKEE